LLNLGSLPSRTPWNLEPGTFNAQHSTPKAELLGQIKEFYSREKAQEAYKNEVIMRLLRFFAATTLLNLL
jgi:hypothetical protein